MMRVAVAALAAVLGAGPVWAAELELGQVVSGEILDPAEPMSWTFEAAPGTVVFAHAVSASSRNNLGWVLEDEHGRRLLENTTRFDSLGRVPLMGGAYTVRVYSDNGALGSFELAVDTVQDIVEPAVIGATVSGAITHPGQRVSYPFVASGGERLVVELLDATNKYDLTLRVEDAYGQAIVPTTSFLGTTDTVILDAGEHVLVVEGKAHELGSWTAQLRAGDAATSTLEIDGAPVVGFFEEPGSEIDYTFEAEPGERIYLDYVSADNRHGLNWRLATPDGDELFGWTNSIDDSGPHTLTGGTYTLSLRAESGGSGAYELAVRSTPRQSAEAVVGGTVSGDVAAPGQEWNISFSAAPGERIFFDFLSGTGEQDLTRQILNAHGRVVAEQAGNISDFGPIALAGGDYTMRIRPEPGDTGTFEIGLVSVTDTAAAATLGGALSGAITQPGQVARYAFVVDTPRVIRLDTVTTSNSAGLNFVLTAGDREVLARTTSLASTGPLSLVPDTYTLTIDGEGDATGSYEVTLSDLGAASSLPVAPNAVILGQETSGAIASAGVAEEYAITVGSPGRLFFDLTDGASNLRWSLVDRLGHPVFTDEYMSSTSLHDVGPVAVVPGPYTLRVRHETSTPSYAFVVTDTTDVVQALNVGVLHEAAIATPGSTHRWTFDVAQTGRYHLELEDGENGLYATLLDPVGRPIFQDETAWTTGQGPWTLTPGQHTLIFHSAKTPSYAFRLHEVTDHAAPLALDQLVEASIDNPGSTRVYTLTVDGPTRAYFDVLQGHGWLSWTLVDPVGRTRFDVSLQSDRGPMTLTPGEWTLTIRAQAATTPEYRFRVVSVVDPPTAEIGLGQAVQGTFGSPGEVHRFDLTVAAGMRVYFNRNAHPSGSRWSLRSPEGRVVFFQGLNQDFGPTTLTGGTWRLTLQADSASGDYAFEVVEALQVTAEAPERGVIVEGQLGTPGGTLSYPIVVAPPTETLLFDLLLESSSASRWRLVDPAGAVVFDASASDWTVDQGPLTLKAGEYTLTFSATNHDTPFFAFRLPGPGEVVEIPDGCAACEALDMVFIFDTSLSMEPAADNLCQLTASIVAGLEKKGVPVKATFLGITNTDTIACVTGDDTVLDVYGEDIPGDPPDDMNQLDSDCSGLFGGFENWAAAAAIVAARHPWAPGAVRLVVPVSDEGPWCGGDVDSLDLAAVDHAAAVASANGVILSPIVPEGVDDPVEVMVRAMAEATQGIATIATFTPEALLEAVGLMSASACDTQGDATAPVLADVSPAPGTPLVAGEALTISGRVQPVNHLRPILAVLVDGVPAPALDASGRFFAPITVAPGQTSLTIEVVEECGSFEHVVAWPGAGPEDQGFDALADVSPLLTARYSRTSFDRLRDRLVVDVQVENTGPAPVDGPILMAIESDLSAGVAVSAPDGLTPEGRPWLQLLGEGEVLAPGEISAGRPLAFDDPPRRAVRYTTRWLTPKNHPPRLTTIPVLSVTTGQAYRYEAAAEDSDGHTVTWSLPVAPAGMTVDAGGVVTWTAGSPGDYDVRLVAHDGRGGRALQSFAVTVRPPGGNRPPVLASAPPAHAAVGAWLSYLPKATDADGDLLAWARAAGPEGLTVDGTTGLVTWPFALPGNHEVSIRVEDGAGGIATQSWTLTVGEVPGNTHAPLITSTPPAFAAADELYLYLPLAHDPDGDPLTWTLEQGPEGMSVDAATGRLDWTPTAAQVGPAAVVLRVDDSFFGVTEQAFIVMVTDQPPNGAPIFTTAPPTVALVGAPFGYLPAAVDPEGGPVTYARASGPEGATVDETTGALSWTPDPPGVVTLAIVAQDGDGAISNQTWLVNVRAENQPPAFAQPPASRSVWAGQAVSVAATASDPDGDAIEYAVAGPAGLAIDPWLGVVGWTPGSADAGVRPVTVTATDAFGAEATASFDLTVLVDTTPPEVVMTPSFPLACLGAP